MCPDALAGVGPPTRPSRGSTSAVLAESLDRSPGPAVAVSSLPAGSRSSVNCESASPTSSAAGGNCLACRFLRHAGSAVAIPFMVIDTLVPVVPLSMSDSSLGAPMRASCRWSGRSRLRLRHSDPSTRRETRGGRARRGGVVLPTVLPMEQVTQRVGSGATRRSALFHSGTQA